MKKPTKDQLINAFRTYLAATGNTPIIDIGVNNLGVYAHIRYAPNMGWFTQAERRYTTTGEPYYWVRLSKKDFDNELITDKLFYIE